MIRQMVAQPFDTRSDSFYFVDGKLVMHNKADYRHRFHEAPFRPETFSDKLSSSNFGRISIKKDRH
jgi:hypothetical protein